MDSTNLNNAKIYIYPTAILNISEFHNRMRINYESKRVFGALVGEINHEGIQIYNIFETLVNLTDEKQNSDNFLDEEFFLNKKSNSNQLYPNYDVLGFFSSNSEDLPDKYDELMYFSLSKIGIYSKINIVLNTVIKNKETLPLKAFYFDKLNHKFNDVDLHITSSESESVCLETLTKIGSFQSNELIKNYETMGNALGMLKSNLKTAIDLVKDYQSKGKKDYEFELILNDIISNYPYSHNKNVSKELEKSKMQTLLINNIAVSSIKK